MHPKRIDIIFPGFVHLSGYIIMFALFASIISVYPQQNTIPSKSSTDSTETHPQDVSEEAGYVINTETVGQLRIYGSVRLSGAYDLNGLTNANNFSTYDIPVSEGQVRQPRFFMLPYQTRLGLDINRVRKSGVVKLKIETDFLGESNSLRIRHAYVETGKFLFGQTWSSFTDVNSIPVTVDADGPNSSVRLRTVRIRYADNLAETGLRYVVSLEAPNPDVILDDSLSSQLPSQFIPDLAGLLRYNHSKGYITLASILRGITVSDSFSTSSYQKWGYGFLLAGTYQFSSYNKIYYQAVYGRAIARFITALTGKGLDLVYNPASQQFETSVEYGFMFSYTHNWLFDVSSTFTGGLVGMNTKDYEPDDAFKFSNYFSGNLFWYPISGVRLGLEFSHGTRINKDGKSGKANRLGFIFYTDF